MLFFNKIKKMKTSDVALPSNKKFGFFFSIIFVLISTYFFIDNKLTTTYIFFVLSVLFFATTLIKSDLLLPLNKLWMRLGLLLGMIVSPIVLGIIFYGLFTPIGILMRISGRDELRLKYKDKPSHWILRESQEEDINTFKQQF
jgi:polyferredoxin